MISTWWSTL